MKRASAIVTNRGGRTCHAAIVARDPAVKTMLSLAIKACRAQGKYIGICG